MQQALGLLADLMMMMTTGYDDDDDYPAEQTSNSRLLISKRTGVGTGGSAGGVDRSAHDPPDGKLEMSKTISKMADRAALAAQQAALICVRAEFASQKATCARQRVSARRCKVQSGSWREWVGGGPRVAIGTQ